MAERMTKEEKEFWSCGWVASKGDPAPTRSEFYSMTEEMVKSFFPGPRYTEKTTIYHIKSYLIPQIFRTLYEHPKKWPPLHKMVNLLNNGSRFEFWKAIYENREYVRPDELLRVWYDSVDDRGFLTFQKIQTLRGDEVYTFRGESDEIQKTSVITDPLLIDNPIVSYRYCQVKKPGWEFLQYIHGRRHQTLKMPDAMREALQQDNLPAFVMHLDMSSRNIPYSILVEVMGNHAVSIFRYLIENEMVAKDAITLPELCCNLVVCYEDDISIPMLAILEEIHPGLIKSVKDVFGRNLLWYAVQNMRTGWFHPDCKLTPFLLEQGCDPQNQNQLGFTWQDARDGLTLHVKQRMMRHRYTTSVYKPWGAYLRDEQPIEKIQDA